MRRGYLLAAALLVVIAVGSSCKKKQEPQQSGKTSLADLVPGTPTPALDRKAKLFSDLSLMATARPLAPADAKEMAAAHEAGSRTLEAYVDDLLRERMDGNFAKDLILGGAQGVKDRHPVPGHSTLRTFAAGGKQIHYLAKKCDPSDAEEVDPWWGGGKVWVCKSAHRPDVRGDDAGRMCGASFLSPYSSEVCGCGPRLMWCTKDKKQWQRVKGDVQREVVDTVAYVVNEDLPIEQLFTMNETVRTKNAELVYRRARVAAGEDPSSLDVFDVSFGMRAKLTPRHEQVPGQHAGILTAPSMIYGSDALRGVLRNYYDYLWCAGQASSGVTTQGILDLEVVDLREGDGWKQLASMKVCTDCHARLDYGMQFFHGWPSSTQGVDFQPKLALQGKGPLYGDNIDDPRGKEDLTPRGFAKLALSQPEFGECLSRRVVDHVFNGSDAPDDVDAVVETFEQTHVLKKMLRTAMLRYAERTLATPERAVVDDRIAEAAAAPPTTPAPGVSSLAEADLVSLPASLRRRLDNHCMQCHDEGDAYDFNGERLPRTTLAVMLEQVGFGIMPKTAQGLEERERRAFVAELSALLFPVVEQRSIAESFFFGGMRGHSVHRFRSAMDSVAAQAGERKDRLRLRVVETAVEQSRMSYSPTMAVSSGLSALKACKAAGLESKELAECVERASAPDAVVAGSL